MTNKVSEETSKIEKRFSNFVDFCKETLYKFAKASVVEADHVSNNIIANNIKIKLVPFNIKMKIVPFNKKMKLVSHNIKIKPKTPVKQSNS